MRGGVIEALDRAKEKGLVRFVGFTGHKDPALHLQMLSYGYPFDTCQMPLNCFDASFRSFEQQVLPEVARQGTRRRRSTRRTRPQAAWLPASRRDRRIGAAIALRRVEVHPFG